MRSWSVILILAGSVGCAGNPPRIETVPEGDVGIATGRRLGDGFKRVLTKQPPETLLAADGTVCRVSPDRYSATTVGDRVRCDWQPGAPVER